MIVSDIVFIGSDSLLTYFLIVLTGYGKCSKISDTSSPPRGLRQNSADPDHTASEEGGGKHSFLLI